MNRMILIVLLAALNFTFLKSETVQKKWQEIIKPAILADDTGFSGNEQAYDITVDTSGNKYICGYFEGKFDLGDETLISKGDRDIFVTKLDGSGNHIWSASAGGRLSDYALAIDVNKSGECFITGYFYDEAEFGDYDITGFNGSDIYAAKLSASGEWQWAVSAGGSSFDKGLDIKVAENNDVYFTGSYQSSSQFGSEEFTSEGFRDVFLSKLDGNGNWIRTVVFGSSKSDEPASMVLNSSEIFLTGYYKSDMLVAEDTLRSSGDENVFVIKADTSGTYKWAAECGGDGNDRAKDILLHSYGKLYLTGYFSDKCGFGSDTLNSEGSRDIFAAKLDTSGNWVNQIKAGSIVNDEGLGIEESDEKVVLTGYFSSTASFGSTDMTSEGDKDVYFAVLDTALSWSDVIKGGSSSTEEPSSIAVDDGEAFIPGSFFNDTEFGSYTGKAVGGFDIFLAEADIQTASWTDVSIYSAFNDNLISLDLCADEYGNKYITGKFYGQINFGNYILNSQSKADVFVAKVNADGDWVWAKKAGCSNDASGKAIGVDNEGNVYIAGSFISKLYAGSTTLSSVGINDIFVAKLDKDGDWQWATSAGNWLFDEAEGIAVNGDDVYVTGYYNTSVAFGSDVLSAQGNSDIFISKISPSGSWEWAKSAGGSSYDKGVSVATDSSGNVIITGSFEDKADFGSTEITAFGNDDIFLSKLDSSGNWKWAKAAGSNTWRDIGNDIACDAGDNIYLTGNFNSFADFDDEYLISEGDIDFFAVKADSAGNWKWLVSGGSSGFDASYGIAVYGKELYLTGVYSDTLTIGNSSYISEDGSRDIFLAKMDTSGVVDWIKTAIGGENDESYAVAKCGRDQVHVTGVFADELKIGSNTLSTKTVADKNLFLASWGYPTPPAYWSFRKNTGNVSYIELPDSIEPKINYEDISFYDAVAVFYKDNSGEKHSAGFYHWNEEDLTLKAWGDNASTTDKDGFEENDEIFYESWNAETDETYEVDVAYSIGGQYYFAGDTSVIKYFPKPETDTLHINVLAGWNLISTYLEPFNTELDSIFSPYKNKMIIMYDSFDFYIPRFPINDIGEWDLTKAYRAYFKEDTVVKVEGFVFGPGKYNLKLKTGWNLIPYHRKDTITVENAFAELINDNNLVAVKAGRGNVFIPSLGLNTINSLEPGKAYMIYVKSERDFSYPGY